MSEYYNPGRSRNIFDPAAQQPFVLSRSKIDLFCECPRCFYLDRRLGVGRPPGFPFSLNSAVDALLKKEFDIHRAGKTAHPLMAQYGIDAVPFQHAKMNEWRDPFKGVRTHHKLSNFIITSCVDDIWVNPSEELIVVDYKATAKDSEVNIDAPWQIGYKRQIEIYQWLLRQNNFKVSDTGYFVYANGRTDRAAFDGKLEFKVVILPYQGKTDWIEDILVKMRQTLSQENLPQPSQSCDYCAYRGATGVFET